MSLLGGRAEEVLARFRQQKPKAARLAEWVCLAARIEHGLLREARLRLAPELDASAEADLWFSPLVESWSARAFVFNPAIAALLQDELFKDCNRAERAWALTRRVHSHVPPIVKMEEMITWLARARDANASGVIEGALRTILRTMLHDETQGMGVARWVLRAIRRLPVRVQEADTARLLTFGAAVRLGLLAFPGAAVSMPAQDSRWLLPWANGGAQLPLRVQWDSTGLTFFHGVDSARGHVLLVPETRPILLEVAWQQRGQEQRRLVEAAMGARVFIPAGVSELRLRTVAGDEFELMASVPGVEPVPPLYLDQTVWQSCVWIPDREQPTTAYFIDSSTLLTAASAFPYEALGVRIEVLWNGERWWATLREKDPEAGYALLELPGEAPAAHVPKGIFFTSPDDSVPDHMRTWIAYAMSADGPMWIEGTFNPDAPRNEQAFLFTRSSVPHSRPPVGAPLFIGGVFLVGHCNGWDGLQVLYGSGRKAIQARSVSHRLPPDRVAPVGSMLPREEDFSFDEDESEEAARLSGLEVRLDELRELILNQGDVDSLVFAQLPNELVKRKVSSELLPAGTRQATIADVGGARNARLALDLQSLELDGGDSAACDATIDLSRVRLMLLLDDVAKTSSPAGGISGDHAEESLVSLKLQARIEFVTDVPDDGAEMITGVQLSSVEDIKVVAVHSKPGKKSRRPAPSRKVPESAKTMSPDVASNVFAKYMGPLVRKLCRRLGCTDEDATDAALEAIFSYLRAPERHDPAKVGLDTYLLKTATIFVRNRMRSESVRSRREQQYGDIAALGTTSREEEMKVSVEAGSALNRLVSQGALSDEKDIATLRLLLQGENSIEELAKAMGLHELPVEDKRRAVKRYRDRLMRRLARVGKEGSEVS
ncbi:sigma-70 family RNA polymerase sigma factor [Corallococcus exiguus]|uniref:sigma-70 family RNA polymerase sigma factor n=1 Tax=Corallococcus exiguus TaxID=83462 RepID=UPI0014750684|nr:sigma-70 family RNA polymerase sigma factor [Corallococcus exiguus]NNB99628.1 sigma-70 family RNA polymerase sigma factor [Corallococcus exiguus]